MIVGNKKKFKILLTQPYPDKANGVDTVLINLIMGLQDKVEFVIALPYKAGNKEKYEKLGVKIYEVPISVFGKPKNIGYILYNLLRFIPAVKAIMNIIESEKPDILHAHKMENLAPLVAGRLKHLPTLLTVHEIAFGNIMPYKIIGWFDNLFADRIIVLCEDSKNMFRWFGRYSNKIAKIYNGIKLTNKNPEFDLHSPLRMLSVGRLVPMKGFEYSIQAAVNLLDKGYNFLYDIIGDVPSQLYNSYKENLIKQVPKHYNEQIRFLGYKSKVRSLMKNYDILIVPSVYDIFPTVILEAMNAGLAIVGSATGGIKEIIKDNGLLVKPKDVNDLTSKLENLLKAPDKIKILLMKQNSFNRFVNEFTLDKYCINTESLYLEVLDGKQNRSL